MSVRAPKRQLHSETSDGGSGRTRVAHYNQLGIGRFLVRRNSGLKSLDW